MRHLCGNKDSMDQLNIRLTVPANDRLFLVETPAFLCPDCNHVFLSETGWQAVNLAVAEFLCRETPFLGRAHKFCREAADRTAEYVACVYRCNYGISEADFRRLEAENRVCDTRCQHWLRALVSTLYCTLSPMPPGLKVEELPHQSA